MVSSSEMCNSMSTFGFEQLIFDGDGARFLFRIMRDEFADEVAPDVTDDKALAEAEDEVHVNEQVEAEQMEMTGEGSLS